MKRLVIFCDGTWNCMSADHPTNVLIGSQLVLPSDAAGVQQVTYYDEGVGTIGPKAIKLLEGAFGWGLLEKIEAAYRFLIFNYEPGDEIYIFGFSRGAYSWMFWSPHPEVPRSGLEGRGRCGGFFVRGDTLTSPSDSSLLRSISATGAILPCGPERSARACPAPAQDAVWLWRLSWRAMRP